MIKHLTVVTLTSLISFGSINFLNLRPTYGHHLSQEITVYSVTYDEKHGGRTVKTSIGRFFLTKSKVVLYWPTSGSKMYGSWETRSAGTVMDPEHDYIYLGNRVFYLTESKFTDEPYMVRVH